MTPIYHNPFCRDPKNVLTRVVLHMKFPAQVAFFYFMVWLGLKI